MTPTAVISFLALLSFGSANVMMKKGESVTFSLDDNGLLWPLPDSNEPGGVIYHAVHCYQMSEGRVHKADDKISQAHLKHCDKFTQKVLEFFKKIQPLKSTKPHATYSTHGNTNKALSIKRNWPTASTRLRRAPIIHCWDRATTHTLMRTRSVNMTLTAFSLATILEPWKQKALMASR